MKLVFLVTFGLILSTFIVDSGAVEVANRSKELKYLDEDCRILILEHLEFPELLNAAQINDEFSRLAANVFRRKHSHLSIMPYHGVFPFPKDPNEILAVAGMKIGANTIARINKNLGHLLNEAVKLSYPDRIDLFNGDQILNTFKHFGHVIKKFITNEYDDTSPLHSEFIGKLINKYSTESLTHVEIKCNTKLWLKHFDRHLPNLEHIYLEREEHSPALFEGNSMLPGIIRKNRQIRSIELFQFETEFVKMVNMYLPHLETLKLSSIETWSESIRFKNVTTLSLGESTHSSNLHFPRLQRLHIDHIDMRSDEHNRFLNEHKHLRHLHVSHSSIDGFYFRQFTANLSDLEELTLQTVYNPGFSAATIFEFLRNHNNMKKLSLFMYKRDRIDVLQEQLKHEWNITITQDGMRCQFERKTTAQL